MGALRLTLLRHGHAEAIDSHADDFERELTRQGVADAQEMAARLVRRELKPDLILASPAKRAATTASIVATACSLEAKRVQYVPELYLATPGTIWHCLTGRESDARHVLVCGHNPGLSEIASQLGPTPRNRDLPTAGLATAVWLEGHWATLEPEFADQCDVDNPQQHR